MNASFRIEAIVDPQTMPRVAGFFAQRALIPDEIRMRITDDRMTIKVSVSGLALPLAGLIARKLGEAFAVIAVDVEEATPN